jgi:hypothetical protein
VNPTFDALIEVDVYITSEGSFSRNSTELPGILNSSAEGAPT